MKELKITDTDYLEKDISGLPDKPSTAGMTAAELKDRFDTISKTIIAPKFNDLVDLLDSPAGAGEIGSSPIPDISGDNIKAQVVSLRNKVIDETPTLNQFNAHKNDQSNPHMVTKAQVGLGNADNTSDLNKPISAAVQAALNLKANQATTPTINQFNSHINDKTNPHTVTKSQVGLSNADNTSDLNKPVSTLTQAALNQKVDKIDGKGLSAEDFTSAEKTKLLGIQAGAQVNTVTSVAGRTGAITLSKGDVGLSLVDNTPDASKPISAAVQTALDLKANQTALDAKLSSLNSVTPVSGNIDIVGGTGITVIPGAGQVTVTATGDAAPGAHASSHASDGSDPISPEDIGALSLAGGDLTGALSINTGSEYGLLTTRYDNPYHSNQFEEIKLGVHGVVYDYRGSDWQVASAIQFSKDYEGGLSLSTQGEDISTFHRVNPWVVLKNKTLELGFNAYDGTHTSGGLTLTGVAIPTNPEDAANKEYVDSRSAADIKATGYTKPGTASAITATDTVNQALGKLEVGVGAVGGKRTARFVIGTSTAGWTAKDCDYLCDGVADEVEINAAIQALPEHGGEIKILDGEYNITAEILINKSNVKLSGNGGSTVLVRNFNTFLIEDEDPERAVVQIESSDNCVVEYLRVDGNKLAYNSSDNICILIKNESNNNIIKNNIVTNSQGVGICITRDYLEDYDYGYSVGNIISHNICTFCANGIYVFGAADTKISDNISNNHRVSGIYITHHKNYITNNVCNNNGYYGIYLSNSNENTITGNVANGNSKNGVSLSSVRYTLIVGNDFTQNNIGIEISNYAFGVNIMNNNLIRGEGYTSNYTSSQHTLRINAGYLVDCIIVNNNCMGKAPTLIGVSDMYSTMHGNKWRDSEVENKILLSSGWTGEGPYTYSLTVTGVTATSTQEILPPKYTGEIQDDQIAALQSANIVDGGQSANTIILKALGEKPEIDIPIRVVMRGDI